MKIHIQRNIVEDLVESLDQSYAIVYDELTNSREIITGYLTANLMEIDKTELNKNIDSLILVLKEIKAIKKFNPKKPLQSVLSFKIHSNLNFLKCIII